MARAGKFLVVTGEILVLDSYHLYTRDLGPEKALTALGGLYSVDVDEPTWITFRFKDIVRHPGPKEADRERDHASVFIVDGGSVVFMDRSFLPILEECFDPKGSGVRLVREANDKIAAVHGQPDAILIERGAAKGKGEFVGDGDYYFKDGAMQLARGTNR